MMKSHFHLVKFGVIHDEKSFSRDWICGNTAYDVIHPGFTSRLLFDNTSLHRGYTWGGIADEPNVWFPRLQHRNSITLI